MSRMANDYDCMLCFILFYTDYTCHRAGKRLKHIENQLNNLIYILLNISKPYYNIIIYHHLREGDHMNKISFKNFEVIVSVVLST